MITLRIVVKGVRFQSVGSQGWESSQGPSRNESGEEVKETPGGGESVNFLPPTSMAHLLQGDKYAFVRALCACHADPRS